MISSFPIFLIGTHNQDKAALAIALLNRVDPGFKVLDLEELGLSEDVPEFGSLLERSTKKALTYINLANTKFSEKFDFVLGIDDAIAYSGQDFDSTDSKRATEILLDGGAENGAEIIICHAMTLVAPPDTLSSFIVNIPFTYVKPVARHKNVARTYPLLHVLRLPGRSDTLDKTSFSDYVDYYWTLSSIKLIRAMQACGAILPT